MVLHLWIGKENLSELQLWFNFCLSVIKLNSPVDNQLNFDMMILLQWSQTGKIYEQSGCKQADMLAKLSTLYRGKILHFSIINLFNDSKSSLALRDNAPLYISHRTGCHTESDSCWLHKSHRLRLAFHAKVLLAYLTYKHEHISSLAPQLVQWATKQTFIEKKCTTKVS